jgi:hypothetical protein
MAACAWTWTLTISLKCIAVARCRSGNSIIRLDTAVLPHISRPGRVPGAAYDDWPTIVAMSGRFETAARTRSVRKSLASDTGNN